MNPRASAPDSIAANASSELVTPQILTYGHERVAPLKKCGRAIFEKFGEFKEWQEFKEIQINTHLV